MNNKIGYVVLNWNSYDDTIACCRSILDYEPFALIVVVDNLSNDDSRDCIKSYCVDNDLGLHVVNDNNMVSHHGDESIIMVLNSVNNGYAGGNNLGLKYLVNHTDIDYYCLINNDAVLKSPVRDYVISMFANNECLGFVGGLSYYADSGDLQCYGGGKIYPVLGQTKLAIRNVQLDYIMGVFLVTHRRLINDVGYMPVEYFLYYEEVDWQTRALERGWVLDVCSSCEVSHQDSKSTKKLSSVFYFYHPRSAIIYFKRHHANLFVLSFCFIFLFSIKRAGLHPSRIANVFKGIVSGLKYVRTKAN